MGILHRLFARRGPEVWQAEMRLLHRFGFVRPPAAVQWISTSACDLACPHCYSHAGRCDRGELTTDEARRLIIDELVELDRPTMVIAGGEPLLRRDFAEIVEYAHDRRVPWALHSHGGHVERLEDVLRRCPPAMAAISLDGPREFHDRFRGRSGSFDAALRAIRTLKRAGCPEVVAGTTITRENADLLADMVPVILASGADSWGFHLMTPEGRAGCRRDMLPAPDQLRRAAALARRLRAVFHVELDDEWGSAGADDCFYRDDPFICGAGRFTCVVAAGGDVMPCTTTDPGESQGNVRRRRLSEIWADGFAAFRTAADPAAGDPEAGDPELGDPELGDAVKSDCLDCWLQTRHGHSCRGPAFYDTPLDGQPQPAGELATQTTGAAS